MPYNIRVFQIAYVDVSDIFQNSECFHKPRFLAARQVNLGYVSRNNHL